MRKITILSLVLFTALGTTNVFASKHGNGGGRDVNYSQGQAVDVGQFPKEELSESEKEGLVYMLEEEKLARDVYKKLYESYKLNVFINIPNSEQRHIDAVRDLAEKYGLDYKVTNDKNAGVFENKKIQALYNDLVTKGERSLVSALEVGATIEDVDIYDLQEFLKDVDNEDIQHVYEYLIMGSENHLRAFNRQLIKNGQESYQAQYISQEEVDNILAGTSGHGVGRGNRGGDVVNSLVEISEPAKENIQEKSGLFSKIINFFNGLFK